MCDQTLAGKFLACPKLCKGNLFGAVYCSGWCPWATIRMTKSLLDKTTKLFGDS